MQRAPNGFALATLVVNAYLAGHPDQANDAATQLKQVAPGFRISHTRDMFRTRREDLRERVTGALRMANIPE